MLFSHSASPLIGTMELVLLIRVLSFVVLPNETKQNI